MVEKEAPERDSDEKPSPSENEISAIRQRKAAQARFDRWHEKNVLAANQRAHLPHSFADLPRLFPEYLGLLEEIEQMPSHGRDVGGTCLRPFSSLREMATEWSADGQDIKGEVGNLALAAYEGDAALTVEVNRLLTLPEDARAEMLICRSQWLDKLLREAATEERPTEDPDEREVCEAHSAGEMPEALSPPAMAPEPTTGCFDDDVQGQQAVDRPPVGLPSGQSLPQTYSRYLIGNIVNNPTAPLKASEIAKLICASASGNRTERRLVLEWIKKGRLPGNVGGPPHHYIVDQDAIENLKIIYGEKLSSPRAARTQSVHCEKAGT
jgi:hypothetical protein